MYFVRVKTYYSKRLLNIELFINTFIKAIKAIKITIHLKKKIIVMAARIFLQIVLPVFAFPFFERIHNAVLEPVAILKAFVLGQP